MSLPINRTRLSVGRLQGTGHGTEARTGRVSRLLHPEFVESENRRCAWIARYVASHVELVRGVRDVFDDEYHLVYVSVEGG